MNFKGKIVKKLDIL